MVCVSLHAVGVLSWEEELSTLPQGRSAATPYSTGRRDPHGMGPPPLDERLCRSGDRSPSAAGPSRGGVATRADKSPLKRIWYPLGHVTSGLVQWTRAWDYEWRPSYHRIDNGVNQLSLADLTGQNSNDSSSGGGPAPGTPNSGGMRPTPSPTGSTGSRSMSPAVGGKLPVSEVNSKSQRE
ncbi:unnamed protein product [Nezara viridula]|uniref:Uncharacterized protein n=1 Tax=Nezara viridula TaxID=85310 RepID=A0A9P0MRB4_NEZVI|nr:unnamed protein product [Nezara viridula]